jgi:hypothetical protein
MNHRQSYASTLARQVSEFGRRVDHSTRDRLINRLATPLAVAKVCSRHSCHASPYLVMPIAIVLTIAWWSVAWPAIVMTVVT